MKTYLVTNNSEGSICVAGRCRIDIPGKCQDMPLQIPGHSARQTIARLKRRYPLLKIKEASENKAPAAQATAPASLQEREYGKANKEQTGIPPDQARGNAAQPAPEPDPVEAQAGGIVGQASPQKSNAKKKQG